MIISKICIITCTSDKLGGYNFQEKILDRIYFHKTIMCGYIIIIWCFINDGYLFD